LDGVFASAFYFFIDALQTLCDCLEIFQDELGVNDREISERINGVFDVDNIVVIETAKDHDNSGDFAYVGEKFIAETGTFRSALHEAGDIKKFNNGGNGFFRAAYFCEFRESSVGDGNDADVGVDGTEGVICNINILIC